ncbi:folylpolyglutamate synthase/dihydrofolate synthase family protein [Pollutibacter soli]|uniref:bifunctional folylpolyglutamate synthase/dihydrofolate synthase n=1 Tax=Pollutibacter soli TaxID=3034157 RepID=UPI003013E585
MTYTETLDFLYQRLPMFSRIGTAAYKKDLGNTIALCDALGNPQNQFRSIHIAGTNGKGSVSHMLASVLQSAGYLTGLYTSPHLVHFGERIRINGEMINEEFVVDFTEKVKPLIDKIEPSFFELTVAMAFYWFAEKRVDVAVIETGLGGRLDSTNIILPELSIITNISWDHANILGDSLKKIAGEKAGIIKPHTPVIVGETDVQTKDVFKEKADECSSPLIFADQQYMVADWKYEHHHLTVTVEDELIHERQNIELDLTGFYQTKNLLPVLSAIPILHKRGFNISKEHIKSGLQNVKKFTGLHGRWELIHQKPDIILDVAHNEAGVRQVVTQLELMNYENLHIVLGMVRDKDINPVLNLLPKTARYYFSKAQIPRALSETELQQKASEYHLTGDIFADVNIAIQSAKNHSKNNDLILVCGSVFLVGEVNTAKF